jgi:hypothetical protein
VGGIGGELSCLGGVWSVAGWCWGAVDAGIQYGIRHGWRVSVRQAGADGLAADCGTTAAVGNVHLRSHLPDNVIGQGTGAHILSGELHMGGPGHVVEAG